MRLEANPEICVASGQCVMTAPGVFAQDEQRASVVLLDAEPDGEAAEAAAEAVDLCPSGAIRVVR